jgi:hypothetical protein
MRRVTADRAASRPFDVSTSAVLPPFSFAAVPDDRWTVVTVDLVSLVPERDAGVLVHDRRSVVSMQFAVLPPRLIAVCHASGRSVSVESAVKSPFESAVEPDLGLGFECEFDLGGRLIEGLE